jgi:photosystem II protein
MAALTSSFAGTGLSLKASSRRQTIDRTVSANKAKPIDISKQGLNSIKNKIVKQNLMGVSESMSKKGWKDSQGRSGKGFGVYRFAKKYGANVDGYSPIYTPDTWTESGNSYKPGTKGLLAWAGLVTILLGVGINLVLSTSQLGQ